MEDQAKDIAIIEVTRAAKVRARLLELRAHLATSGRRITSRELAARLILAIDDDQATRILALK